MVTNGLLLSAQRLEGLLKAGMHSVTISLDGLEEDHNWMRGHEESFRRVDEAISMLVGLSQISFDIVTCVNRRNYSKLSALREYLIGKGVRHWRIFTVFPVGRAANDPELRLSDDEFRGVFEFIHQTRQEGRIHLSYGCEGFLGRYEGDVRDHFFTCQAGKTVGSVLVDGSISACTSIRSDFHQGNIYRDDFWEVWQNGFVPYRDHSWMKTGECADCRYWKWCEGNGMHLRDKDGSLMMCHLKRINDTE